MAIKHIFYLSTFLILFIFQSCGIKTAKEAGLHFSTEKSKLPDTLNWKKIGFAKELINTLELIVVISGGTKPIPMTSGKILNHLFPTKKT